MSVANDDEPGEIKDSPGGKPDEVVLKGLEPLEFQKVEQDGSAYFTSIAHKRENNALTIAQILLLIFGISLVLAFGVIIALIVLACRYPDLILTKVSPALEDIIRIVEVVGTIFSPLLAFILGFYFSNERRKECND